MGRALASLLPEGAVVALHGELASGKTCFVRGAAAPLSSAEYVNSPTFTIVNEYLTPSGKVYHLDLYHLGCPEELADLGYEELFDAPDGVCFVEWAERAGSLLPEVRVDVFFEHAGEDVRTIRIVDAGVLSVGWRARLETAIA